MNRKWIIAVVAAVVVGGTVAANWTTIMGLMMTTDVDPTSGAKIISIHGNHEASRMDTTGNSQPIELLQGESIKTADLIIGSDDPANQLDLALDAQSKARFDAADFVLRSLLGQESTTFSVTIEIGSVLFDLKQTQGKRFEIVDTNKNNAVVDGSDANFYVQVDDDGMQLFVRSGQIQLRNSRTGSEVTVKAGQAAKVDAEGNTHIVERTAQWIQSIEWVQS